MSLSDQFRLEGKVALVTGASRGIGLATARTLHEAGAEVWFAGRDCDALTDMTDAMPRAHVVELSVTDEASIKAAMMQIRKVSGGLDILVNNAGIMEPAVVALTKRDSIARMMDTNLTGSFLCAQLASRLMMARKGGSIINLASIMGTQGAPGYAAYGASKAAVVGMTKAMAKELAASNIRVNALAPGFIVSDMTNEIKGESREEALAGIRMGRFGSVDDVAMAALYFASPASAYVTGQVLTIDGSSQS